MPRQPGASGSSVVRRQGHNCPSCRDTLRCYATVQTRSSPQPVVLRCTIRLALSSAVLSSLPIHAGMLPGSLLTTRGRVDIWPRGTGECSTRQHCLDLFPLGVCLHFTSVHKIVRHDGTGACSLMGEGGFGNVSAKGSFAHNRWAIPEPESARPLTWTRRDTRAPYRRPVYVEVDTWTQATKAGRRMCV